ncbi:MAG: hypothetical protein ICV66_02370 [Chitinophagaceae bacterium]|nr:hypothetical protein [Chitinophagaceae bacterium]
MDGYWYGKADVINGASANNYLVELIIRENKTSVSGVINYYFRNTYRTIPVKGNYNSLSRKLTIFNLPVTYFGSGTHYEVDCMMDLLVTLRASKTDSNLIGKFISKAEYKIVCPELTVKLKLNKGANNQDSILTAIRKFKETYQVWTPSGTDTAVAATIIQRPIQNYVVNRQYKDRENVVNREIYVESDTLKVDLYDNGEIDGDSISIFFNNQLLAASQKLSAKAIHLNIVLDKTKDVNELTMFAENLGSIPPNTALMLVYDGRKRYEARITSTLQKNATVNIRRKR